MIAANLGISPLLKMLPRQADWKLLNLHIAISSSVLDSSLSQLTSTSPTLFDYGHVLTPSPVTTQHPAPPPHEHPEPTLINSENVKPFWSV